MRSGPVYGFDLDMTLVDSRPGIAAALRRMAQERDHPIDVRRAVDRIGPPIDVVLAEQLPVDAVPDAVSSFRRHLAELLNDPAAAPAPPLPGAAEALAAVQDRGGSVLVVTAKPEHLAAATMTAAGLPVDRIQGARFGTAKIPALVEAAAAVYVGDQPSDMRAALAADVLPIAVRTGGVAPSELTAAGAAHVLEDLTGLSDLLALIVLPVRERRR